MSLPITTHQRPRLGISACLLGAEVRFNGGHTASRLCSHDLSHYVEFVPLRPEVTIGLGVPLVAPLTLLKHHLRRYPDRYLSERVYLQPHPENLSLRNVL